MDDAGRVLAAQAPATVITGQQQVGLRRAPAPGRIDRQPRVGALLPSLQERVEQLPGGLVNSGIRWALPQFM